MKGIVKKVVDNRGFGFIKGDDGIEYFFHKSSLLGFWDDLNSDLAEKGAIIWVEFEIVKKNDKGPRAENVKRMDWPN